MLCRFIREQKYALKGLAAFTLLELVFGVCKPCINLMTALICSKLGVFENNLTTSNTREMMTVLSKSIEKLPLDNGLPLFV